MSDDTSTSDSSIHGVELSIPDGTDIDRERVQDRLNELVGAGGSPLTDVNRANWRKLKANGQADGDSTVIPVSNSDRDRFGNRFDKFDRQRGRFLDSPTIRNLEENTIDYSADIGQWLLEHDDLTPGVIARFQGILLGQTGLTVEPTDADSDADTRLVDYLESVYTNDPSVDLHVSPNDVVDQILADNVRYARSVFRSTDLEPLAIETLREVTDGRTGERLYIQEATGYTTYEIADDGTVTEDTHQNDKERALFVGEDVLDAQLYRNPPLASVADDIVNKLQLKRLKSRKAEVASIGGIYITVTAPSWLKEEEYSDTVSSEDNPLGDFQATKLEIAIQQDIDAALETLQSYQTATIMSLPEHWEVDTVQLPEMDETFDSMIRGYNQSISRRLLLPFDLLELERGSELSRESMMGLLGSSIAGWQQTVIDVFDAFARIQADIQNIGGSVEHSLPALEQDDEKQIVQLLNFAGLLGLSQPEARKLVNNLEGVDIEVDQEGTPDTELPPAGGPTDPATRQQQMRDETQQRQQQIAESLNTEIEQRLDAEAARFGEGDVVEYGDGNLGVVLEVHSSTFTDADGDEHDVPDGETAYVVARETGGFGVYPGDDLASGSFPDDVGGDPDELADAAGASACDSCGTIDAEGLGFDPGEPEGWTRLSYLKAYSSVGGSFSSCVDEMDGEVRDVEGWCAALKDEVYNSTGWR